MSSGLSNAGTPEPRGSFHDHGFDDGSFARSNIVNHGGKIRVIRNTSSGDARNGASSSRSMKNTPGVPAQRSTAPRPFHPKQKSMTVTSSTMPRLQQAASRRFNRFLWLNGSRV